MRCDDCRDALNAYVDGELMPDEREMIRHHLASCLQCASEYEALVALSRGLKEELEWSRAPDVLKARIRSALVQPDAFEPADRPRRFSRVGVATLAAAGLVIAAVSAATSFIVVRHYAPPSSIAEQVLSSHIRSLMPGHLTDVASNDLHNVKPWFNGRLDLSPAVPRLDSAGFPLVGGRLDYVGGRAVAVIVYMRRLHVINVFSWPSGGRDRQATAVPASVSATVPVEHGYHLVHWSEGGEEFWAASDLAVPELRQFVALFARAQSAAETP